MLTGLHRMMVVVLAVGLVLQIFFSGCRGQAASSFAITGDGLKNISMACSATRFDKLCKHYFLLLPDVVVAAREPAEFVKYSITLASQQVNSSLLDVDGMGYSTSRKQLILEDIRELLGSSMNVLMLSLGRELRGNNSFADVRHWLSAALTYNNDCYDYLSRFSDTVSSRIRYLSIPLITNALWALDAFETNRDDFSAWRRTPVVARSLKEMERERRDGNKLIQLEATVAKAVVSHDPDYGSHTSIQAAVDDAPDHLNRRYTIYITAGVYDEIVRIPSTKTMIAFVGDGINKTVITGNLSTVMGISTYRTATVAVSGNGFLMRDITVVNTAGPGGQAVAMRVDSDMAAIHRCSFWGFQDTLYTHAYRQFYRDCSIYGTIDFIFGNAASVFQNCNIQIRPGAANHTMSTITAHGRTDPAQDTAFVCQSCWISGTPEYLEARLAEPGKHQGFLGRPWKPYARAIFIESYLDVVIDPSGWLPWNGTLGLDTVVLAEFHNYGPGASPIGRVGWSKQLNTIAALEYSVRGLIQGGYWLPFTGVPYRLVF
ncbi:pectinesterase [Selaginella moellendorffii]|nr:pectinesterase [Selaginella moellendorffii]|eukprot:XP_002965305.2 pectinesterase [Selaginella moellendorffii]